VCGWAWGASTAEIKPGPFSRSLLKLHQPPLIHQYRAYLRIR
jgi:hypothetical protein